MRRKLLTLLVCSSLTLTLFSACGKKTEEVTTSTQQNEKSESSSKEEPEEKSESEPTQKAEEEPSMSYFDDLQIDKGMEVGETYTYSGMFPDIGAKDITFTLDSVEFADADTEGYRTCTVSYTKDDNNQYTDAEASTLIDIAYAGGFLGFQGFYAIADGKSGLDLEGESNEYDVTVEVLNDELERNTLYRGEQAVYFTKKRSVTAKITYPKDYKDLCFGFGGAYKLEEDPEEEGFFAGKIPFAESVLYTPDKVNSRWVNLVTLDK